MIKFVNGSVLDATEDIILHQVNCQNVMGAGVAKALYTRWPVVKETYHTFCRNAHTEHILGSCQVVQVEANKYVANIFGQLNYGRNGGRYTSYEALNAAFYYLVCNYSDHSIAIPHGLGCGLAGGDWEIVYKLIKKHFAHMEVTIYRLKKAEEGSVAA